LKKNIITFCFLIFVCESLLADPQVEELEQIEQITVTTSKRDSQLLALDSNLSVLSQDTLEFIEHEHINQALSRVPGGWISRGNGQEHLTAIRSPVLTGAGGCGAFFIAQDGIGLRAPGFCNANQLFDANTEQAQRIEVLRGPASTLYGSNAVHGVINIITPNPFDDNPSNLGLGVGPHDYLRGIFSATTISDNQGFMFYGNITHDGGYKDESGFDQQKINFIHQYQSDILEIKSVFGATNLDQNTAGFIKGFEGYKDEQLKRDNPNPEAYRDSKSFRAYSDIKLVIDENTQYQIMPYVRLTEMEFLQHYLPWQSVEQNEQLGFGFQSNVDKHFGDFQWRVGLDIDITEGSLIETQENDFSPSIPKGEHYNYTVDANVYSMFNQLTWTFSSKGSITAGARFDKTIYDYRNHLSDGDACDIGVANCRFTRPENQKVDYAQGSYQLGGHYLVDASNSIYGTYSKGYRAPQATELFRLQSGQTFADLDAEKIDSFEIGFRGQHQSLFYDLTAFTMRKNNFIFQDTNKENISNGKTSHNGFEFSVNYQLSETIYVNANGTLANHTYDSSLTLSRVDIEGNEIDTAPQHMGSVQIGWKDDKGTRLELEWLHIGNYFVNPENTAEYDGHNILNFRMNAEISSQWVLSTRVLNLTNQDYAERADYSFGTYRYFVGEPRSVFVSLKYMFEQ
jgi:outer membrane receptor protein involved in Fe transport